MIVFNRGGTGEFGVIKTGFLFLKVALFARAGYVVFASQYSGNGGSEGVDEMGGKDRNDVLNLYPIIKSHPNCDKDRIGMFGWSRGAMMNYLAMREAAWMKAVVSVAGENDQLEAVNFRKGWGKYLKEIYGGNKKDSIDRSVLYWVDKLKSKAPVLLVHGGKDVKTNPMSTLKLAQKFQESGRKFELVFKSEEDHEFSKSGGFFIWNTAIEWFDKYLKTYVTQKGV